MNNSMEDLLITHSFRIPKLLLKASSITEVRWNLLPQGWIKCNIYESTLGSLGRNGCGGIFRTCHSFTKGCFAWSLGFGFAFETKIMAFILAIEKAHEFGWSSLWVESDSLYVFNLYK